jgi:hypothetical protein
LKRAWPEVGVGSRSALRERRRQQVADATNDRHAGSIGRPALVMVVA